MAVEQNKVSDSEETKSSHTVENVTNVSNVKLIWIVLMCEILILFTLYAFLK